MARTNRARGLACLTVALAAGTGACFTAATSPRVPPPSAARPEAGARDIHPGVLRSLLVEGELTVSAHDAGLTREVIGGEGAEALVRVCLDDDGNATATLVRGSARTFDAAALAVVQRWRFRPYQRGGARRAVCSVAAFSHSFDRAGPRPALPSSRIELPPAIEAPVSLSGRLVVRRPTPGVAFARVCRTPGTRAAPRFSLLQSSGDRSFDRALFDEPVTAPAREKPASREECWLRAGISGRRQAFDFEILDPDAKEVPPSGLETVRVSGDRSIFPPDSTKLKIRAAGISEITVPLRVCIDTAGVPVNVRVERSSGFFTYDMELINAVAAWRYRPVPVPLCSSVQFIYRQR